MTPHKKSMLRKCPNKRAYPSLLSAQIALKKFKQGRKAAGNPIVTKMNVYACQCGAFHIGKSALREIDWDLVMGRKDKHAV